jgi:hypothetical protein
MFMVLNLGDYNDRNVFITDSIRNIVIDNSSFVRIIYSTSNIVFNGIAFEVPFHNFKIARYFNKWRCMFSINDNTDIIRKINHIEQTLLQKTNMADKNPCCKISDQLNSGFIKIFLEDDDQTQLSEQNKILLKISGIWVSEKEYGITYKFIITS